MFGKIVFTLMTKILLVFKLEFSSVLKIKLVFLTSKVELILILILMTRLFSP